MTRRGFRMRLVVLAVGWKGCRACWVICICLFSISTTTLVLTQLAQIARNCPSPLPITHLYFTTHAISPACTPLPSPKTRSLSNEPSRPDILPRGKMSLFCYHTTSSPTTTTTASNEALTCNNPKPSQQPQHRRVDSSLASEPDTRRRPAPLHHTNHFPHPSVPTELRLTICREAIASGTTSD